MQHQDDGPVLARLAALKDMSVKELKAEWAKLFETEAPNNSRSFLEQRLAYRIQELTFGGLSKPVRQLLDAMVANPRDWRIEQVETVVRAYGLTIHCPGGSHHIVRNAAGKKVSIPAHRPIKPIYIRQLVRLIQSGQGDDE